MLAAAVVVAMLGGLLVVEPPAHAGNASEGAQSRAQEDIVPKIAAACGVALSVKYDGDSLRKHNKDIGYDQTSGSSECDEPLRYLWYACRSPAGQAAVKAARISKVVCTGTAGPTGALTLSTGTLTVERAFEEPKPYLRSRKQFEAALKLALPIEQDDPYYDQAWHDLEGQPNPVTDTKTFCVVNGQKVAFDQNAHESFRHRKEDARVKCWKDGEVVTDLVIERGRKTGILTYSQDKSSQRLSYRDDKQHGEQKTLANGKLKSVAWYESGERVWVRELHPSGKLASYSHKFADGFAELSVGEDGRVYQLRCLPAAKDVKELRQPCGFEGATTTEIYDGTKKVARVQTWKDGVIQKEGPGTSDYGSRSEVSFTDGKKHGQERVFAKNGNLATLVTWDRGTKHGKELSYADDGKKVVKEVVWKAGETTQLTEYYLNGNPKLQELYDSPKKKRVKMYWDTGNTSREGVLVACENGDFGSRYDRWCEEGVWKGFFENGAPKAEETFRMGKRQGASKSWWANGKPASVEDYVDDRCTKAKRWDKDGKLAADEEYEADGSRRLQR